MRSVLFHDFIHFFQFFPGAVKPDGFNHTGNLILGKGDVCLSGFLHSEHKKDMSSFWLLPLPPVTREPKNSSLLREMSLTRGSDIHSGFFHDTPRFL